MDRYRLIVLASVISWHASHYGQQADENALPVVAPVPNVAAQSTSPQSTSLPSVMPSSPAPSVPVPVVPTTSTASSQPPPQEALKKQESAAQALDGSSTPVQSVVQTPVQPSVVASPPASVLVSTPVVVQPVVQETVPQPGQDTVSPARAAQEDAAPQGQQKEQTASTPSADTSALAMQEEANKEGALTEQKTAESEKGIEEPTPSEPQGTTPTETPTTSVEEEPLPDIVGIDTVNVEAASGNWLLKRIWFERAQEQYEKTKALFDKVLELRFTFFAKRTELDRTLFDPFYMKVGIGQGELLEIINRLLQDFQEMRNKEGALSAQENVLYERVEQEKETLERLQKDITGVTEIDAAVETAINQLVEQVNTSRNYEKQSWETFKEISKQLSDKKARELYYVMDTYRKNSSNIVTYLQRDFSNYMQLLERMAHEQIDRIMTTIDQLKQKNVDFKEQAQRLEQKRYVQETARKPVVTQEPDEEVESQGMVASVWSAVRDSVMTALQALQAGLYGIYTWIWPQADESEIEVVTQPGAKK